MAAAGAYTLSERFPARARRSRAARGAADFSFLAKFAGGRGAGAIGGCGGRAQRGTGSTSPPPDRNIMGRVWMPHRSRCPIAEVPVYGARGIKRYEKQDGRKRDGVS